MRVAIAPSDVQAVADYRVRWPAQTLARHGEIELVELEEGEDLIVREANRRHGPGQAVGLSNVPDVDVIVFPRLLAGPMVDAIPFIQAKGIAVVVDVDDDFRHAPPTLAGRNRIDPGRNPRYNWRHLARACKTADLVTYSTRPLQAFALHGRSRHLPNCVPSWFLKIDAERDGSTVGWGGTVASHPGDLEMTRGGVATAVDEHNASFMVVGDKTGVRKALGLSREPFGTGTLSHQGFVRRLAELDVGIAPLADNVYTRAKSGLKVLQYMSLGIPWVASPGPEYEALHAELRVTHCQAAGALASSRSREWRREVLRALRMRDADREEACAASRWVVSAHHLLENEAYRWAEAWWNAIYHHDRSR